MLFFKRILNFTKESVAKQEQRHSKRYDIAPGSPLRVAVHADGRTHPGRLVNLSGHGAGIDIASSLDAAPGTMIPVDLSLDEHVLNLTAQLIHAQLSKGHTRLGLQFILDDFESKRGYLQLLEPVAIGQGLRAVNPRSIKESEPGLSTTLYHGPKDTLLRLWRKQDGQDIQSFELRMHDYYVRSSPTSSQLDVFTCEEQTDAHKSGYAVPVLKRAGAEIDEIRQLYRWVLPHLNPKLPADVREFLTRFN